MCCRHRCGKSFCERRGSKLTSDAAGDVSLICQPDCCPVGQFCCGTFCEADGARPYDSCIPVSDGCCTNRSNICASRNLLPPANTPRDVTSPDSVVTDGSFRGSAGTRGFVVDTGQAEEPSALQLESGAAIESPCKSDCCITGTFCCGSTCREDRLAPALTCPAKPDCCSDPLLPCFGFRATSPPIVPDAPLPTPMPSSSPPSSFPEPAAQSPSPLFIEPSFPDAAPEIADPAPQPAIPPGTPFAVSSECPDGCEPWWGRCAGHTYAGPGCCTAGSTCIFKNAGYSNCVPDELDPTCSVSGGSTGVAGRYCQCAGSQYFGPRTCGAGLDCIQVNPFYSQCRPVCEASIRSSRGLGPAGVLS